MFIRLASKIRSQKLFPKSFETSHFRRLIPWKRKDNTGNHLKPNALAVLWVEYEGSIKQFHENKQDWRLTLEM